MTKPSWGTKRNCPSCSAHFYDLNKSPASCPKCKHQFDPATLTRSRRKPVKREAPEKREEALPTATILAAKKITAKKIKTKNQKQIEVEAEGAGEGIGDIAEIEDVDDVESLQELSELEEREEPVANEDDADDESIIEELGTGEKALVADVEEEEAKSLDEEADEEEQDKKKAKAKKKAK